MTEYRYPATAMITAHVRAGAGLVLTLAPLFAIQPALVPSSVLGGCALLFGVYGVRTLVRQLTRIHVGDDAIRATGPLPLTIAWRDLTAVKLGYYPTRRDGRGGWMQLNLKGVGKTMRIESSLDGFSDIIGRAIREAQSRGIELTDATRNNLRPLGIATSDSPKRTGRLWPIF